VLNIVIQRQIRAIVAVSANGVMGQGGKIPWHYPEDLQHFKALTVTNTVVMGRSTWESLGCRPLPDRINCVVSSTLSNPTRGKSPTANVTFFPSLKSAIEASTGIVYLIGGRRIYEEGHPYVDIWYKTCIPDEIPIDSSTVLFPELDMSGFKENPVVVVKTTAGPDLICHSYSRRDRREFGVGFEKASSIA
jgi:dihydrofolate reductase